MNEIKQITWEAYYSSKQDFYLDNENAADQTIVYDNDNYEVRVAKNKNEQDHIFSGNDDDFVMIDSKDGTKESYLLYDCTITEAIEYVEGI